jgi:hypothetical protein
MLLLIQLLACFALIFLSGFHWCAYKVDKIEDKKNSSSLNWSIVLAILGLYHLIALLGGL